MDARIGVDMHMQRIEDRRGLAAHGIELQKAVPGQLAPQKDRIRHGQVFGQQQFLVNDDDAHGLGLAIGRQHHGLPVIIDGARGRLLKPRQYLDQGGLAGAILTDNGVHLARLDIEIDTEQYGDVTKGFGDPVRRQNGGRGCAVSAGQW